MLIQKKLVVVDSNNLIYRMFYSGVVTPTLFFRNIRSIIAKFGTQEALLIGDSSKKTWRHDICETYKQNRFSTPPELLELLREIPRIASEQGFQWIAKEGYEADDVIYSIAVDALDTEVTVVAADKDLLQLLEYPHVKIWDNIKRKFITHKDVVAKFGVEPKMIGDFLALSGDSSDNIPGVPKIGPKTAATLLNKYKTLENLLANLDSLGKDYRSQSIRDNVDLAQLSKKLVALKKVDVKIEKTQPVSYESDIEKVIKEAYQYGWVVFSRTVVASANYWSKASIFQIAPRLDGIRMIYNAIPDPEVKNLRNAEDLGLLHHILYGAQPRFFPDSRTLELSKLWQTMQQNLVDFRCSYVYYLCDRPIVKVLQEMKKRGVMIDMQKLDSMDNELASIATELEKKIYHAAGKEFLISSPQQLAGVLNDMDLTKTKKTDARTLEHVEHPIVSLITEYRHIKKLLTTYIVPLRKLAGHDKRVRTSYTLSVTKTGRLSSTKPNLQNIPIKTELGRKLRGIFRASDGNVFLCADYDQMELRILAHMGPIEHLVNKFHEGVDWHKYVAETLFGASNPENRRKAKGFTFGLMYGMSAYGLAQNLKIPLFQAQEIRKSYYERFSGMKEYQSRMIEYAKKYGYVKTLWGRRCYVSNDGDIEKQAVNLAIQGTAADLIKRAMRKIPYLILQVHDELVAEVPENEIDRVAQIMKSEMEYHNLAVPITVNLKYGKNWSELEPYLRTDFTKSSINGSGLSNLEESSG